MVKFTLVPESFFEKDKAYDLLSQAVQLDENDKVTYQELPEYKAVLVYAVSDEGEPAIAGLLRTLPTINEFNRLVIAWDERTLNIALATGNDLKIANSYPATDIITAEYFIMAVLNRFQVNPKVTVIYYSGNIPFKLQNELFRYFKGVEKI